MGLFDRLVTGFKFSLRCLDVLRDHPVLLVFPVLGALSLVGLVALSLAAFVLGAFTGLADSQAFAYGAVAVYYFVAAVLTTFFNAALVHEATRAFRGETPTVGSGLAAAWSVRRELLVWGVVSSSVGLLLRALENQRSAGAQILRGLLGFSWAVLTYFVVPVLVFEDAGVRETLRRSGRHVRDTWGEAVGLSLGVGLLYAVGVVVWLVAFVAVLVVVPAGLLVPAVVLFLLALAVLFAARAASVGVAKAGLYQFAVRDETPEAFAGLDLGALGRREGDRRRGPGPGTI